MTVRRMINEWLTDVLRAWLDRRVIVTGLGNLPALNQENPGKGAEDRSRK